MKKNDLDQLDLKQAFSPMPNDTKVILQNTIRSLKKETKQRSPLRIILIAVMLLMLVSAAALAAGKWLNLSGFFQKNYSVSLPDAAEKVLAKTEHIQFEAGPVTFTVQEALCDGHHALLLATAKKTDGGNCLCIPSDSADFPIGNENGKILGLSAQTTWLDAAKELNVPLYGVSMVMSAGAPFTGDASMADCGTLNEDKSLSCISMVMLREEEIEDTFTASLDIRAAEIDKNTGETIKTYAEQKTLSFSVLPLKAEKQYIPDGSSVLYCTPDVLSCQLFDSGVHFTLNMTAGKDADQELLFGQGLIDEYQVFNEKGELISGGTTLTDEIITDDYPAIKIKSMLSTDSLPDKLIFKWQNESVVFTVKE